MIGLGSDKYLEFSGQSTDRTTSTSFMLMSIANGFIQRYISLIMLKSFKGNRLIRQNHSKLHIQGCINCAILLSGIGARGVSSEHVENMEMLSCSPTLVRSDSQRT